MKVMNSDIKQNKSLLDMPSIWLKAMLWLVLLFIGFTMLPEMALAQAAPPGTCTTDPQFVIPDPPAGQGILSAIATNVKLILESISQDMFLAIVNDGGFRQIVNILITLYIAIYGILFTFGMVQITVYDFIMRMVKIGVVAMLITASAWSFFNNNVVQFFNDGTDDIINEVTAIAISGISDQFDPGDPSATPFATLDLAISKAVSAKMAVTLLAMIFTGPYGLLFGILLLVSLMSFIRSLFMAIWVYLMGLVLRTLLFGIAPIFICCLLFNRTRHLFDGWLNQVVNSCLQPIFLFIFFAFFVALIGASIDQILTVPVCWTEAQESLRGTPFHTHYWRFTIDQGSGYEPYGGLWSWTGTDNPGSPIFPIDIMVILILLMLAELAGRFNRVVLMIASDIAGASTNLASMQGALSDWFSPTKSKQDNLAAGMAAKKSAKTPPSAAGRAGGNRGGSPLEQLQGQVQEKGIMGTLREQIDSMSTAFRNRPK